MSDTEYFYRAFAAYKERTGDARELLDILDDTATFRAIVNDAQSLKLAGDDPENRPKESVPDSQANGQTARKSE